MRIRVEHAHISKGGGVRERSTSDPRKEGVRE
jgi:hypothetical protein